MQDKFCLASLDHMYPPLFPGVKGGGVISLEINNCTWTTGVGKISSHKEMIEPALPKE